MTPDQLAALRRIAEAAVAAEREDKLALNADEEKAIELKREFIAHEARKPWNPHPFDTAQDL